MRTILRHRALLLAALIALSAAGGAAGESVEKTLQNTYPLAAGGEVVVENVNGSIVVESWDGAAVRVRVTKKVRAGSPEAVAAAMDRLSVRVQASDDRLRLRTDHSAGDEGLFDWLIGRTSGGSVSYHLTVPRGIHLDAETVNGAITLRAVDGDFRASATNGAIRVEEAQGRVDASTVNGSISVALDRVDPGADLDFETTNGSVTVALPADIRADLRLRTTNGRLRVDFPLDAGATQNRRSLDAALNGGGGKIDVETVNGGISILES